MVRTISATEAKVKFGTMARRVRDDGEPLVVESHGQPVVAIVPVEHVERLRVLEEQEKRRVALENIRTLQREISARNRDLTPAEADDIAGEMVRSAIDSLFEKGIVRYAE